MTLFDTLLIATGVGGSVALAYYLRKVAKAIEIVVKAMGEADNN